MDLFDKPEQDTPVPEPWMKRNYKWLLVAVASAIALFLTITRPNDRGLRIGAGESLRAAPLPDGKGSKASYDLAALDVFKKTLMRVNDSYVDPTRIDPKQMLLQALDQMQKQVAEVMVEPHADQNKVVVRVDTAQREFDVGGVDSPWTMVTKMHEICTFIQQNMQPGTDGKDLEYALTNGMLSTLDPHSVLLDPALYSEMRLNTSGHFGGLGIVIGIRKGALTVLKPMPNTPASQAGVKAGDKIVRIEKESTVNMMLNDAVNRLRGEPDTQVEIWLQRGDAPAKRVVLTRAVIQVKTIEAHLLKNGVGYVKLTQFAGNSVQEMDRALEDMKQKGPLKGIILDMRGDPGGLLDQAIKVTDEFVESGTIVTTVDNARKTREEKRATPGNQPHVPMAVLVDGGSASASEIVAGALKNLDRAVIVGSRTFGKGSVQVLYDNDDGSALKLTIAQYLTPGDVSIQSVGIMPDVAIEPALLLKDRVSIFRPSRGLREQDLDAHLTSRNTHVGDKPIETVRYLVEQKKPTDTKGNLLRDDVKAQREDGDGDPDEEGAEPPEAEDPAIADEANFKEDYSVTFARELLSQAHGWKRHEVLSSSRAFFDKKAAEEQSKIAEAAKKLGVDWSAADPKAAGAPLLVAQLTTDKPGNAVKAGDSITLKATVTNKGTGAATQVRGITRCDDPLMEDREFLIGRLAPGQSREWTVPVKVDRAALTRLDTVRLLVGDAKSPIAAPDKMDTKDVKPADAIDLKVDGLARPRFAYAYQLIDDVKGNGDGLVQRGEEVRLHVTVKNIGDGKAYQTLATLSNKSGEGVDVNKGRFTIEGLQPGESKSVDFTFGVSEYKEPTFALEMDVYDTVLHEVVTDKLTFPVVDAPNAQVAGSPAGVTVTAERAEVHAGAANGSPVIGWASRGSAFKVNAKYGDFYRIEIEPGRPAFLAMNLGQASQLVPQAVAKTELFTPSMQVVPPRLAVGDAPLAVDSAGFTLRASASDDHQVADAFVFVSNHTAKIDHRKVFYRSNRKSGSPKAMRIEGAIPLWPGVNTVTVVARQSNQVQSQQTLIIQRKGGLPSEANAHAAK